MGKYPCRGFKDELRISVLKSTTGGGQAAPQCSRARSTPRLLELQMLGEGSACSFVCSIYLIYAQHGLFADHRNIPADCNVAGCSAQRAAPARSWSHAQAVGGHLQ